MFPTLIVVNWSDTSSTSYRSHLQLASIHMLSSLQVILLYILWLYLPTSTLIWFDLKHAVRKAFCSWSNQTFSWSMMAIQTGAISCAHIFSCAGSVQASDLAPSYLQAAGQVKEHCRLSDTVMCHGVPKSNGHPTRNLFSSIDADSQEWENLIEMGWTGQTWAWWWHYLKDKKSVLLLGIYRL